MQRDSNLGSTGTPRVRHRKRSSEVVPETSKENGDKLLVNDRNKYKSMLIRAYSTVWMIAGFALIVYMGHLYITAMVVVIQIFMAKELFNLLRKSHEDRHLPGFRLLNWHFFLYSNVFRVWPYSESKTSQHMTPERFLYQHVSSLIKFYVVHSDLKKKMYKYQFGQYAYGFDRGVYSVLVYCGQYF